MDGRTGEARLLKQFREQLINGLGGNPTALQQQLVDRCAMLQLRLHLLDRSIGENGGLLSDADSRRYLAWSNSVDRALHRLSTMKVAKKPVRSLQDVLADIAADKAAASA